ncbi:MAG: DUF4837 family protein [Cryomorphaceae bacterium]|nr:DUF4837 family protein [Cryomorphaceae bacterium]
MNKLTQVLLLLFLAISLPACQSSNEENATENQENKKGEKSSSSSSKTLPPSSGAKAEVIVVCDDSIWQGKYGSYIRNILRAEQPGTQTESYFDLFQLREKEVKDMLLRTRHLILIQKSNRNHATIIPDKYARPQNVVKIEYSNAAALDTLIKPVIRTAFITFRNLDMEIIRKKWKDKSWPSPKKMAKTGITFVFPKAFQTTVDEKDLVVAWASSKNADMVVFVSTRPFGFEEQMNFGTSSIIEWRDSICKIHVPADAPGSYTQTETLPSPETRLTKLGQFVAYETRGYFKSVGDYMGGSFINFTVIDEANERLIMMDGLIYAPNERKRSVLLEMEAMFRSLEVTEGME